MYHFKILYHVLWPVGIGSAPYSAEERSVCNAEIRSTPKLRLWHSQSANTAYGGKEGENGNRAKLQKSKSASLEGKRRRKKERQRPEWNRNRKVGEKKERLQVSLILTRVMSSAGGSAVV